jgi:hypothetical protein
MIAIGYRAGLVAVALVAAPLTGCGGSDNSCTGSSIDFGLGAHGAATPRDALTRYLRTPPPGLPTSGWQRSGTVQGGVTFRSGASKVEEVQATDRTWLVDGYEACN